MGYSCSTKAANMLDIIGKVCIEQTGSQNVWTKKGNRYFFETSRREHPDGSITGSVYKFTSDDYVAKIGSFKIDPDGNILNFPFCPVSFKGYVKRYKSLVETYFSQTHFAVFDNKKDESDYDLILPAILKDKELGIYC